MHGGVDDIKNQQYFKAVHWNDLYEMKVCIILHYIALYCSPLLFGGGSPQCAASAPLGEGGGELPINCSCAWMVECHGVRSLGCIDWALIACCTPFISTI